jgi:hypothetical protein
MHASDECKAGNMQSVVGTARLPVEDYLRYDSVVAIGWHLSSVLDLLDDERLVRVRKLARLHPRQLVCQSGKRGGKLLL